MEWDPTQFFRDGADERRPFALLVLNQPINENAFKVLNKHACFTICADGGANQYYNMMQAKARESVELPDAIVGDLDSLSDSIRKHYEGHSVPVIQDRDQYSTDFTKCLKYLEQHAPQIVLQSTSTSAFRGRLNSHSLYHRQQEQQQQQLDIVVLGGLGGRVDQAFSQIHHLYAMSKELETRRHQQEQKQEQDQDQKLKQQDSRAPDTTEPTRSTTTPTTIGNLYLVSEESITFILHRGRNTIHTPMTNRPLTLPSSNDNIPAETISRPTTSDTFPGSGHHLLEENVGIIPLTGTARLTTHGLQWDVTDWSTQIGDQISTSNHIRAETVEVETSERVLFTLELATWLKFGGRAR